jgi:hypothetical protein
MSLSWRTRETCQAKQNHLYNGSPAGGDVSTILLADADRWCANPGRHCVQ